MVGAISEILVQDDSNNLPSEPYIWVDLTMKPWVPPILEHRRAIDSWENDVGDNPVAQIAPIQQYVLYRRRFSLAVDLVGGFDSPG